MDARFDARLLVAGVLSLLLLILELRHRQWLAALGCAVVTTTIFALAVISMRRNKHHRNGRS